VIANDIQSVASRYGVTVTIPELECDIDAQIAALLDPDHPKEAVFLARGNSLGNRKLPPWIFVECRAEGTLLTNRAHVAASFQAAEPLTDDLLAAILGYPESKADLIGRGDPLVAQALDAKGCVVFEAGCSKAGLDAALAAAAEQVPEGGCVHMTTVEDALGRRIRGNLT
jgi:hypothetical protein